MVNDKFYRKLLTQSLNIVKVQHGKLFKSPYYNKLYDKSLKAESNIEKKTSHMLENAHKKSN